MSPVVGARTNGTQDLTRRGRFDSSVGTHEPNRESFLGMLPRYFVVLLGASALAIAFGTPIRGQIHSPHPLTHSGESSRFERGCEVRHGCENLVQLEATQL